MIYLDVRLLRHYEMRNHCSEACYLERFPVAVKVSPARC
jgi:hypothetical protein